MKVLVFVIITVLATPIAASAQEWTSEQEEVIARLRACLSLTMSSQVESANDCYHSEYVGWNPSFPTPMPISLEFMKYYGDQNKIKSLRAYNNVKPLHVQIYGDVAIIHYVLQILITQPEKEDQTSWYGWTDIMLKENGKWVWIADHGRNLSQP